MKALKQHLTQIDQLAFQRETEMKALREEMNADDVVGDLIGVSEAEYEGVYERHLAQFEPRIKAIRDTFPPQDVQLPSCLKCPPALRAPLQILMSSLGLPPCSS